MSEKRFEVIFYGDVINCVRDETGKEYNLQELISILMEQQATINKLKSDIEETEISIKLFEDDIATKDKKIEEQQAEIERLQKIIDLTQYQLKVQDRILKEVGE